MPGFYFSSGSELEQEHDAIGHEKVRCVSRFVKAAERQAMLVFQCQPGARLPSLWQGVIHGGATQFRHFNGSDDIKVIHRIRGAARAHDVAHYLVTSSFATKLVVRYMM